MSIISNPNGAHLTVTDFATGLDAVGNELVFSNQKINSYAAGSAIVKGQALMAVAPTATAGLTVIPMTAAVGAPNADVWRFVGVALEAGAANDQIRVGECGIFRVLHDASFDPAVYDLLCVPGTSTGDFDGVAGTPVDDSVPVGYFLSITDATSGSTDTALAYLGPITTRFATE
jgi:hypothetical protein